MTSSESNLDIDEINKFILELVPKCGRVCFEF